MQTQKQQIGIIKLLLRDDLAPEDEAMLQALYSRNATSAEERWTTVMDVVAAIEKARRT